MKVLGHDVNCGCGQRHEIITQGQWQIDALAAMALLTTITIAHGGDMSNTTRRYATMALYGAISALLIDGLLKSHLSPK